MGTLNRNVNNCYIVSYDNNQKNRRINHAKFLLEMVGVIVLYYRKE